MAQSVWTSWIGESAVRLGRAAGLALFLGLAGCMSANLDEPPSSQQAPVAEGPPLAAPTSPVLSEELTPPIEDQIKVALLLPLSGSNSKLGEALLHGAEMALFETGDDRLQLLVKDTGGSP
ncbi:MAG: penicillin-binding protein activator, partial [Rhodospirillales bacterium]|nr:penicillin-binding protein activator [Rhodospirillales bacterium]